MQGTYQETKDAPLPSALPASRLTGGGTTDSTQDQQSTETFLHPQAVSPRGRPPPRVASPRSLANVARPGEAQETSHISRDEASDSTTALEEELRKRREAKCQKSEDRGNEPRHDEGRSKQQRTTLHRHEEARHAARDTRRSTNLEGRYGKFF